LSNPDAAPARAYVDAARRLMGEQVPMVIPGEKKSFMTKLFGRRVA
jgi:septum site-determining protein MinD